MFVFCVLVMAALPGMAQAGRCFAPKTALAFKPTVAKTKFNISESAFDLHSLHGGQGRGFVTGLALSPLDYDFEGLFKINRTDGGYCVRLDKIKVAYQARPAIYISKEFPRGSCEFKAVLSHETKHVRALRRVHAKSASDFKAYVQNSLERVKVRGPLPEAKIKAAQKKIQEDLQRLLDEKILEINAELLTEQNKIDSPGEYENVERACTSWSDRLRLQ